MTATSRIQGHPIGQLTVAVCLVAAPLAYAEPIPLTVQSGPSIQQIGNRPCIIGDPSCHNPASFPYTLIAPQHKAGSLSSPTYTVDQIRSIVGGDTFFVGLDLNQAMGHNDGAYTLESFTMAIDGRSVYATSGSKTLFPLNPGNGYSDASIAQFDLTGLSGSATLVFTATFSGATAGREQFFLSSPGLTQTPNASPTPEPATMILLGSGLAGLGAYARHRRLRAGTASR